MSRNLKNDANRRPDPYAVDRLAKIPAWIKVGVLKFWLYGAVFFFTVYGFGGSLAYLDLLAVTYLVLVLGIEYVANTLIVWMHTDEKPTKRFLPHEIRRKSPLSLFATAGYAAVVFAAVNATLYVWVDLWGLPTFGSLMSQATADPITFALFFMLYDAVWIFVRAALKRAFGRKDHV